LTLHLNGQCNRGGFLNKRTFSDSARLCSFDASVDADRRTLAVTTYIRWHLSQDRQHGRGYRFRHDIRRGTRADGVPSALESGHQIAAVKPLTVACGDGREGGVQASAQGTHWLQFDDTLKF
jgi:hypothetical protein